MNRIDNKFKDLKSQGKKAFVAYITAGDPDIRRCVDIIYALEASGVDILELGVPFSDPLADGVVNQMASQRSIEHGTTLVKILEMVRKVRKHINIPIVLFTYYNPVLKYGVDRFSRDAQKSGVDGVLVLDLPPEEAEELRPILSVNRIHMILLAAPTSTPKRIQLISEKASGFIYYVSRTGVTGMQKEISSDLKKKVSYIKKQSNVPVVVGFGVSNCEQVRTLAASSDGVVVGSAIVQQIGLYQNRTGLIPHIKHFVRGLVSGLH
ncbi:MAG: tryptophan synthase subunit alpha [Chlamydiota bacterium]|nr:tryptophan synthase subunit alpha [Chlamydiota bacterium]